jgi:acyl-CoA thioester hydrolase
MSNLTVMKAAHSRLARPAAIGRVMGIPSKAELHETLLAAGTRH